MGQPERYPFLEEVQKNAEKCQMSAEVVPYAACGTDQPPKR